MTKYKERKKINDLKKIYIFILQKAEIYKN